MRQLIILASFFISSNLLSQTQRSIGIHLGIPIINEKLADGFEYRPFQLLFYYNFTNLLKGKKNDLFVYLEPQLVWVHFSPKRKKEFEFGANLGLEYRLNLSGQTAIIAAVGSGPHYISAETPKQAKGFIFSDNFTLGLRQALGNSGTDLHLRARFRHISNANLKKPNNGIDSWFLIFGATKEIGNH
ncbi:MAG TPA: acyloxyacyl hydrolase [Bacteroidetes bacterium]|nr:acyloxyacyl hydrolase [Bacteroidota bacterium]